MNPPESNALDPDTARRDSVPREQQVKHWLRDVLGNSCDIVLASADASFRRYFRVRCDSSGRATPAVSILMDAPPELEDSTSFVEVATRLERSGLRVPKLFEVDLERGFLLLEDFGGTLLFDSLSDPGLVDTNAPTRVADEQGAHYREALDVLVQLLEVPTSGLPAYSAALLRTELELFDEWFIDKLLGIRVEPDVKAVLNNTYSALIDACMAQPQVFVHRDFHSRNLMILPTGGLGIIDFQDAVCGPVTYDLVSLLRDAYVRFSAPDLARWRDEFLRRAHAAGHLSDLDSASFAHQFDLMGLQRHLKVAGIFARLYLRDGKTDYLGDIPGVIASILDVGQHCEETQELVSVLREIDIAERYATALSQHAPELAGRWAPFGPAFDRGRD